MKITKLFKSLIFVGLLLSAAAQAETRTDVINGATCVPYPPNSNSVAVPYSFWLYGFNNSAFCHITMPDKWNVDDLKYVFFGGGVSSGQLTARLCVYAPSSLSPSCGSARSISSSYSFSWVAPPANIPSFATGAYVLFSFPSGHVSTIRQLIPYWSD